MRFRRARTPRRAGRSWSVLYERPPQQRETLPVRCKAVLHVASCDLQRAARFRVTERERVTALTLCWEEAQHSRLRRARAPPRWLESAHVLRKHAVPARRPPPSVHGFASTCRPRPPTSSRRSRVRTRELATGRALSLGRRRSKRACDACAFRRICWSRPIVYERTLRQGDAPLPRCTALLRRTIHGLQRAAGVRVCAHANTPLGVLSLGRRRSKRACGARAPPRWLESANAS